MKWISRIEKKYDNQIWTTTNPEYLEPFPEGFNYFAFIVDVVSSMDPCC